MAMVVDVWTIFDTCTKPDYYLDLHRLLALPEGATIRYEYRQEHLSDRAVAQAASFRTQNRQVLLAYGQRSTYSRGDDSPEPQCYGDMFWMPTRGARIANLTTLPGSVYAFDLELLGYPRADDEFEELMAELVANDEVPYRKWVSLSTTDIAENELRQDHWVDVVNRLGVLPSQFAGDSFWRIPNYDATTSGLKFRSDPERPGHRTLVLREKSTTRLDIESYHPAGAASPGRQWIAISSASNEVTVHPPHLDLRTHSQGHVDVRVGQLPGPEGAAGELTFSIEGSERRDDPYPIGADLHIRITVEKNARRTSLGLALFMAAVALFAFAATTDSSVGQALAALCAIPLVVVAVWLFSGQWALRTKP